MEEGFTWNDGPDCIIPSDSLITTGLNQCVKLRLGDGDTKKYPPISIYSMLQKTVNSRPNHLALVQNQNQLSYSEYWDEIHTVAKSFIKVNLFYDLFFLEAILLWFLIIVRVESMRMCWHNRV